MNPEELMQALQKFLQAVENNDPEEAQRVLEEHPELLPLLLAGAAGAAEQQGETELAGLLKGMLGLMALGALLESLPEELRQQLARELEALKTLTPSEDSDAAEDEKSPSAEARLEELEAQLDKLIEALTESLPEEQREQIARELNSLTSGKALPGIESPDMEIPTHIPPSTAPRARWAKPAREYLARRENDLLQEAIQVAQQEQEEEIAALLQAFKEGEVREVEKQALALHRRLLGEGREEEAWTVALFPLDLKARWAEQFNRAPLERQNQALAMGLAACRRAAAVARGLNDPACVALYKAVEGTGCYHAGRWEEARQAYAEALEIRRALASERPEVYRADVAMTLNNLGNVLSHLRRLEEAR
ncbi:MAG: hypothetical protein D6681_09125, partial [Calditrichaeota bacterium]